MRRIGRRAPAVNKLAGIQLPSAPRERDPDISRYNVLVYGRGGVGKTTLTGSYPKCMMLSCERISRGLRLYDFNADGGGVTHWDIFRHAVDLLETDSANNGGVPDKFRTVGVDTIDAGYELALRAVCDERGIDHPEDQGWGKGWSALKKEFAGTVTRIHRAGYGIVLISHSKEVEVKGFSGNTFTRIQPTASGQAYAFAKGFTDNTFYAEWMKTQSGKDVRVLITVGDEIIDAKNSLDLPKFLELPLKGGYEMLCKAAAGNYDGIKSSVLIPSRNTSEAAKNLLQQSKKPVTVSGGTPSGVRRPFKRKG